MTVLYRKSSKISLRNTLILRRLSYLDFTGIGMKVALAAVIVDNTSSGVTVAVSF